MIMTHVVVQAGDTLSGIAARFGDSLASVEAANPQIRNDDLIFVGQSIEIPSGPAQDSSQSDVQPSGVSQSPSGLQGVYGGSQTPGAGLPPIFAGCIINAESSDRAHITSGLYGILQSTWASLGNPGGYSTPGDAPVSVQNQAALTLYDRYGLTPWYDPCVHH